MRLYNTGTWTYPALADRYGVRTQTISRHLKGRVITRVGSHCSWIPCSKPIPGNADVCSPECAAKMLADFDERYPLRGPTLGTLRVPAVDLFILLAALDDLQLDSLNPREEGAIENLRGCLNGRTL